MATRNERKRLAKARHAALVVAVNDALAVQAAKDAAIAARHDAINGVNRWSPRSAPGNLLLTKEQVGWLLS